MRLRNIVSVLGETNPEEEGEQLRFQFEKELKRLKAA